MPEFVQGVVTTLAFECLVLLGLIVYFYKNENS